MQLAVLPIGEYIYFQADNLGAFANPVAAEQLVRQNMSAHYHVINGTIGKHITSLHFSMTRFDSR